MCLWLLLCIKLVFKNAGSHSRPLPKLFPNHVGAVTPRQALGQGLPRQHRSWPVAGQPRGLAAGGGFGAQAGESVPASV